MCINNSILIQNLQNMQIYKVWGEEFEFPPNKIQQVDWSAFYFQHNVKHALRYLSKKWEDGHQVASLIKATLINEDIQLIKLENKQFGDPKLSGKEKAILARTEIKSRYQIELEKELLMRGLGIKNKILEVLDCDQYEVIVPHNLFQKANFKVEIVALFRSSETEKFITQSYSSPPFTDWKPVKGEARYQPYLLFDIFQH